MGAVRFLKAWSLYNPGETAGFDEETTAMLVNHGTAVLVEDEKAEPAKPAKKGKKAPAEEPPEPAGDSTETGEAPAPEAA